MSSDKKKTNSDENHWNCTAVSNTSLCNHQGDHSPDNVKFPDTSLTVRGTPAYVMCYSHHAGSSVIVSGEGRNATVHDPNPK